jgi:hypothetical protein
MEARYGQHGALLDQAEPGPADRLRQRRRQDSGRGQVCPQRGVKPGVACLDLPQSLLRAVIGQDLAGERAEFVLVLRQGEVHRYSP